MNSRLGKALPRTARALLLALCACAGAATAQTITEYESGINGLFPAGIAAGPDGALWFTEKNGDRIGRIDPATGTIVDQWAGITPGSNPLGIVAGPDGALWFTEHGGNRIGRIDPVTRLINEAPAGSTDASGPFGITVGPDGAIWFTEANSDRIGRMDPVTYAVTEYSAGMTPVATPQGIVGGPDGALWFTEFNGGRIGRIDPVTHGITEYSAGMSAGANPQGIAAGSDGALWFTIPNLDRIGRVDPVTHAIAEFGAGITPGAAPQNIVSGADGALWFTEIGSDRIGRIDPWTRIVTEYSAGITSTAWPYGIAAGLDGALWFTEWTAGRIGRLAPPAAQPRASVLAIVGINGGALPVAGTAFNVVVQAQDANGVPRNVAASTGVALKLKSGAGALGGTLTCVIHAGTDACTMVGVKYPLAETGVTLAAARTFGDGWLGARTSAAFAVAAPPEATSYGAGISGFAGLQDIAAGADGAMWFIEANLDRIGRIDPATQAVAEYGAGMTAGANPRSIAAGPDGALWFTEYGGNRIGRIDPATHAITEYSAGLSANAGLQDIAAGPDGAMWFTETIGNRIGRIDPATHAITEFGAGISAGANPHGITAGPDGALWFTEYGGSRIGRIEPATGAITEYASGMSAGANPKGIAAGPDGAIWFVEYGGNRIGRLDLATRRITEYSTGLIGFGGLQDIAAGSDGALWFVEFGGNRVGRIDMSYSITEYGGGIGGSSWPNALAAGPDGALWFTTWNANRIGRLAPPAARPGASRLAVASVNGGVAPAAGVPVNVVIQAQAKDGAPAAVTASTGVSLQITSGGGSLGGKLGCVIAAGSSSCTVFGASYSRGEAGVTLGAVRAFGDPWLASVNSAPVTVQSSSTVPTQNYSDSWWNAAESGWGLTVTDHGANAFVQWYTYDQTGHSQKYVISGGSFSADKCRFNGTVQRTTGPSWVLPLFDSVQVARSTAGTASFDFCPGGLPAGSAVFDYNVDGVAASKQLTRLAFGNDAPHWGGSANTGGPDFTDLWWNPAESGWGVSITQHGNNAYVRIFTYDTDGRPLLFVAPGVTFSGANSFSGALQTATGPYFGSNPFDPSKVARSTVGSVTLSFGDANNGVLSYTVNGIARSKIITRLTF